MPDILHIVAGQLQDVCGDVLQHGHNVQGHLQQVVIVQLTDITTLYADLVINSVLKNLFSQDGVHFFYWQDQGGFLSTLLHSRLGL